MSKWNAVSFLTLPYLLILVIPSKEIEFQKCPGCPQSCLSVHSPSEKLFPALLIQFRVHTLSDSHMIKTSLKAVNTYYFKTFPCKAVTLYISSLYFLQTHLSHRGRKGLAGPEEGTQLILHKSLPKCIPMPTQPVQGHPHRGFPSPPPPASQIRHSPWGTEQGSPPWSAQQCWRSGGNWRLEGMGDCPSGSSCLSYSQGESLLWDGIPVGKPAFWSII